MKNWKSLMILAAVLAAMSNVPGAHGQSPQPTPSSVPNSPNSATRVNDTVPSSEFRVPTKEIGNTRNSEPETRNPIPACMAAANELAKTRVLVAALEKENSVLGERLETEKRTSAMLMETNNTRKSETDALRAAVDANKETIAAKDAVIASQDKLTAELKRRKPSPLGRLGDILIGAAAAMILR